jgi:integrase
MNSTATLGTQARRPKGEGSLYMVRMPDPTAKPKVLGVWRYKVVIDYKNGRPVQASHTFRGMKEPSREALAAVRRQAQDAAAAPAGTAPIERMAFGEFLTQHYLPGLKTKKAPGTIEARGDDVRKIIPVLGHIPLSELSTPDLSAAYRTWSEEGFMSSTVIRTHSTISDALNAAKVLWDDGRKPQFLTRGNPAQGAAKPEKIEYEPNWPTEAEINRLIDVCADRIMVHVIRTMGLTGVRIGELAGLRWGDIDREKMTLRVYRQITHTSAIECARQGREYPRDGYEVRPTKNKKRRLLPISASVLKALDERRADAEESAAQAHVALTPDCYIFTLDPHGKWPTMGPFQGRYARWASKVGISRRMHDLRHHRATWLLDNGASYPTVAFMLGDTVQTIAKTYGHLVPDSARRAAELVGAIG